MGLHSVGGRNLSVYYCSSFPPYTYTAQLPNLLTQVGRLRPTSSNVADPAALYLIWSGSNDFFETLTNTPDSTTVGL